MVVSALFVLVEFNGGSAKATVMTCFRSFFFFLLPYFSPHRPFAGIFFLFFVLILSVRQRLFSPCCFVRAQQVSVPYQHVCCPYGNCSLSIPFRSSCITFFRSPVIWFALLSSFLVFFFCSSFRLCLFLWSGFLCCVLIPGMLPLYLVDLGEMRLFGLLGFTVVCDYKNCISLG